MTMSIAVYIAGSLVFFVFGAIDGYREKKATPISYVWNEDAPIVDGFFNGMMYAVLWPLLVVIWLILRIFALRKG